MSVLAGFSLPTTLIAQSAPRQPNVVIIVADDLGYGDLSCYGAHRIQTPGMDRIANEGIRFTQGYCTAATSTPSRYSLLRDLNSSIIASWIGSARWRTQVSAPFPEAGGATMKVCRQG